MIRHLVGVFLLSFSGSMGIVLALMLVVGLLPHEALGPWDDPDSAPVTGMETHTMAAENARRLVVRAGMGSVSVTGWDQDTVYVVVVQTADPNTPFPEPALASSRSLVELERKRFDIVLSDATPPGAALTNLALTVQVPHTMQVNIRARRGDVEVRGILDKVDVNLDTAGAITILDCTQTITARTLVGDITVTQAHDAVTARTDNGNVSVSLAARPAWDGQMQMASVNGDLHLSLPGGADLRLRGETSNGSVDVSGDNGGMEIQHHGSGRHVIRGTLGQGTANAVLRTVNGDIRIQGAGAQPSG